MPKNPSKDARIVLLHGNDEFEIDQQARALLSARCPDAGATGSLTTLRGDVDTVDQACDVIRQTLSAVQSLNMFSPENATWLREVQFLSGTLFTSETVKDSVEALSDTLSKGLGPEQFLLITVSGRLNAKSRFMKALKPVAEVRDCSKTSKPWEIQEETVRALREEFKTRSLEVDARALEDLAARVGDDRRLMIQEVEKLDIYAGDERKVTRQDVDRLVGARQEAQVFHLGDCIASRDLPRAMELLARMETQSLSPIAVMATLHNTLREMAYLRALIHEGRARVDARGRFGKLVYLESGAEEGFVKLVGGKSRSPFRQFQLGRQSTAFTPGQMDRMLRMSADTYDRMFRSSLTQYELLRMLMIRIFYVCMKKSA